MISIFVTTQHFHINDTGTLAYHAKYVQMLQRCEVIYQYVFLWTKTDRKRGSFFVYLPDNDLTLSRLIHSYRIYAFLLYLKCQKQ